MAGGNTCRIKPTHLGPHSTHVALSEQTDTAMQAWEKHGKQEIRPLRDESLVILPDKPPRLADMVVEGARYIQGVKKRIKF